MTKSKRKYLLTGGGTGGHVYPAIAIAEEIRRNEEGAEFLYVGVRGKAEEKIAPQRGYPIAFVRSRGWPGTRVSLELLKFGLDLGLGILKAILLLRKYKPDVIIATGGYVAAPILLAWVLLKRLRLTSAKAFVHEQNLVPGRLNQLISRLADRVGVSFEESLRYLPGAKAEWVGYPVRREMTALDRQEARKSLGLPLDAKVVLAFGGSQGARTINRSIVDALPTLLRDPQIVVLHGIGRMQGAGYKAEEDTRDRLAALSLTEEQKQRYRMEAYLDPIDRYYAAADIVVCRGGAGTLTEAAICGLATLIVPKANLPGDHQVRNARALQDKTAAALIYERTQLHPKEGLIDFVAGDEMAAAILALLGDPSRCQAMREKIRDFADSKALARIAEFIAHLAEGSLPPFEKKTFEKPQGPIFSDMTGSALVAYFTKHSPDEIPPSEREYLTYRTDGYLASPDWQTRNIGVKLVGLLRLFERLPLLLFILRDKTPVSRAQKFLGGDLAQVGFIRRNALLSLQQVGLWTPEVSQILLQSLRDPYYEARVQAAQTTGHFAPQILAHDKKPWLDALKTLLFDPAFEVTCAALPVLASLEDDPAILSVLRTFSTHPNWKIRDSILKTYQILVTRGILPPQAIASDLEQFLLTSTGFVPRFPLREQMVSLSKTLQQASVPSTPATALSSALAPAKDKEA